MVHVLLQHTPGGEESQADPELSADWCYWC